MIAKFLGAWVFACFLATAALAQSITTGDNWTKYHYTELRKLDENDPTTFVFPFEIMNPVEIFVRIGIKGESVRYTSYIEGVGTPFPNEIHWSDFYRRHNNHVGHIEVVNTDYTLQYGGTIAQMSNQNWIAYSQPFQGDPNFYVLRTPYPVYTEASSIIELPGKYEMRIYYNDMHTFDITELEFTLLNR